MNTNRMNKTKTAENLIDIRKESLKNIQTGQLRPHGKLWGMDVFSWANPELEMLSSTIHSFPFSQIIIAPASLLMSLVEYDNSVLTNIHAVISYEDVQQLFDRKKFATIDQVFTTNNLQHAFQKMNEWQEKRKIVLFCSEGIDFESCQTAFKEYLEIHQINNL